VNKFRIVQQNIILQALVIAIAAIATSLLFNHFSGSGLPLIYDEPAWPQTGSVSVEQAYALFQQGQVLFIDTRYPEEFSGTHIQKAVNVPSKWSMDQIMNFFEPVSRQRPLLVYCSNNCTSGQRLAGFLVQQGFSSVSVLNNGFETWVANGYPVESGVRDNK
jgi:rhodanese-related sulfurtransferase